jgi:hypothetical protein
LLIAEGGQRCGVGHHPAGRTRSTQGRQSITHDRLVLGVDERGRAGTNHDSSRLKIAKQPGGNMLVVKGHDIAFSRKAAYGGRVGVVPDRDIVNDQCRRGVRTLGEQPHIDT